VRLKPRDIVIGLRVERPGKGDEPARRATIRQVWRPDECVLLQCEDGSREVLSYGTLRAGWRVADEPPAAA
jgi:hypothetical protein